MAKAKKWTALTQEEYQRIKDLSALVSNAEIARITKRAAGTIHKILASDSLEE